MTERLILASASCARARLLAAAGVEFRTEPAVLDEDRLKRALRAEGHSAVECAGALAEAKAQQVAARFAGDLVIGADQILVCQDEWFDKPIDVGQARDQLEALRGRTHELTTAVCVIRSGTRLWRSESRPRLTMREFSDAFLDDYLAKEGIEVLGSVGAYRLEGRGVQLFDRFEGDYFAILGLPLLELLGFLRRSGALPS